MLKRILLIVGIGLSFAPAAFAGVARTEGPAAFNNCLSKNGEHGACQHAKDVGAGATNCVVAKVEKDLRHDQATQRPVAGTAGGARTNDPNTPHG
jgi:hypothetical protein